MTLQVLPLAITMMAGPQEMSAIVFVTHRAAVRVSVAFVAGVAIATTVGVVLARWIAGLLDNASDLGDPGDSGSLGTILQLVFVALLVVAAIKAYVGRADAEPPRWLGRLLAMGPWRALRVGLLVILLMPSDLIVLLTVGVNLRQNGEGVGAALPFIGATVLVAALPLLAILLFHRRAATAMPKVRDWMNANSWLVNIIVYAFFVVLILA